MAKRVTKVELYCEDLDGTIVGMAKIDGVEVDLNFHRSDDVQSFYFALSDGTLIKAETEGGKAYLRISAFGNYRRISHHSFAYVVDEFQTERTTLEIEDFKWVTIGLAYELDQLERGQE